MKLATPDREIERVGDQPERAFSIKANGKAFRILSSQLYSNKIAAIVRELSCNAFDAHVVAGKEHESFFVHLPNALEPFFSVRDEGIGLSHDDMETIYTTYFQSTKTDRNDLVGALGLGSKSPFSYVDSFTVTSRHEGVESTYAAFIGEGGEPALMRMTQQPTTEPNGLEVKVPVKESADFDRFRLEAAKIYDAFKVRPTVSGNPDFKTINHDVLMQGDGWLLLADRPTAGRSSAVAIMGNVAYPLDGQSVRNITPVLDTLLWLPLRVEFPIGALDVTAGREELSYDKPTVRAITERLMEVKKRIGHSASQIVAKCATEYEARARYGRTVYYSTLRGAFEEIDKIMFNDTIIDTPFVSVPMRDHPDITVVVYNEVRTIHRRLRINAQCGAEQRFTADATQANTFAILDLERGGATLIAERRRAMGRHEDLFVIEASDEAALKAFLSAIGSPPTVLVSSFPKPTRRWTRSSVARGAKLVVAKLDLPNIPVDFVKTTTKHWKDMDVADLPDGGVYLRRHSLTPIVFETRRADLVTWIRKLERLGLHTFDEGMYAVPAALGHKLAKNPKWQSLDDLLRSILKRGAETGALTSILASSTQWREFERAKGFNDIYGRARAIAGAEGNKVREALPPDHPVAAFIETVATAHTRNVQVTDLHPLLTSSGVWEAFPENTAPLCDELRAICRRYPLLFAAFGRADVEKLDPKSMADYILLIDARDQSAATLRAA